MKRLKHKHRRQQQSTPTHPPTPFEPVAFNSLAQRVLLGAFAALIVSRPLVAGHDPGRMVLTTSGTELSFNLCLLLLVVIVGLRRVFIERASPVSLEIVPLLLAGVGVVCYISGLQGDRYARPALFHAWEWFALAAVFLLARRLGNSERDTRGLLNVLLASAVSIAALGIYQALTEPLSLYPTDLPKPRTDLVGNDEFYPELNRSLQANGPKGTFDRPETFALFSLLLLPFGSVVAYTGWKMGSRQRLAVLIPLILLVGFVLGAAHTTLVVNNISTAWTLFQEHLWWGVGPGNFSRLAPEHLTSAGGAWFALAATTGLFAIGLALLALVFFWRALRRPILTDEPPVAQGVRWDLYYGGIIGLLIGFVWYAAEIPIESSSEEVFRLGAAAMGRAVIWFASFGLLERIRPSVNLLSKAILGGLVLILLTGFICETVLLPTLMFPFALLAGLALNLRTPATPIGRSWSLPFAVAGTVNAVIVVALYLFSAAIPGWKTTNAVREARLASISYPAKDREIDLAIRQTERATALTQARDYLRGYITLPLREALRQDKNNTALMLEIAHWQRPLYRYQTHADPKSAAELAKENLKLGDAAHKLDPHNLAAQRNLYESLLTFQKEAGVNVKPEERLKAINERVRLIALEEPQNEVGLRYRMVQALFDGGDLVGVEAEIIRLFGLLKVNGAPHGTLTKEQRQQIIERAKKALTKPPKELLDAWIED